MKSVPGRAIAAGLCVLNAACAYDRTGDGFKAETCTLRVEHLPDAAAGPHALPAIAGVAGEKVLKYALIGLTYAGQALFDKLAEEGEADYSRAILLDSRTPTAMVSDFMIGARARHRFDFTRGGTAITDGNATVRGARFQNRQWIDETTQVAVVDTSTAATHFEFITEVSQDGQAVRLTEAHLDVISTKAVVRAFPLVSSTIDMNVLVTIQAPLNLAAPEIVTLGAFLFSAEVDAAALEKLSPGGRISRQWALGDLQDMWVPVPRSYQLANFVPASNYRVVVQVIEKAEAVKLYRKLSELMEKAREQLKE